MSFDDFRRAVALYLDVSEDIAMQALDEQNPEAMIMVELLETGSVSIELGGRKFILSVKVEEEL